MVNTQLSPPTNEQKGLMDCNYVSCLGNNCVFGSFEVGKLIHLTISAVHFIDFNNVFDYMQALCGFY